VLIRVLELGLHIWQKNLQQALLEAAHEMSPQSDALVLGYGLCGNALQNAEELLLGFQRIVPPSRAAVSTEQRAESAGSQISREKPRPSAVSANAFQRPLASVLLKRRWAEQSQRALSGLGHRLIVLLRSSNSSAATRYPR